IVKDRGLLKPRMKITAYNQHDVGSFVEPWPFATTNLLPNRANVVMQSGGVEKPASRFFGLNQSFLKALFAGEVIHGDRILKQ
ncbi:MAG TPA: hypothetical protein VI386_09795, partial [Candidatus Sulfotelmatobacter sp.]